ncbi:MAG: hypothetical protein ACOYD4_09860 [Solirubrobacterales bacterium]
MLRPQRVGDLAGSITDFVERLAPPERGDGGQLVLYLGPGEGAGYAARTGTGRAHVVKEFPTRAREVELFHERHVAVDRTRAAPGAEGESRQAHWAPTGVVGPAVEEERAVVAGHRLEGAAIDDDGIWEVEGGDPLPIAPHDRLQRLGRVPGIKAIADFSG